MPSRRSNGAKLALTQTKTSSLSGRANHRATKRRSSAFQDVEEDEAEDNNVNIDEAEAGDIIHADQDEASSPEEKENSTILLKKQPSLDNNFSIPISLDSKNKVTYGANNKSNRAALNTKSLSACNRPAAAVELTSPSSSSSSFGLSSSSSLEATPLDRLSIKPILQRSDSKSTDRRKEKEAEGEEEEAPEELVVPATPDFTIIEEEDGDVMDLEPPSSSSSSSSSTSVLALTGKEQKVFFGYKLWSGTNTRSSMGVPSLEGPTLVVLSKEKPPKETRKNARRVTPSQVRFVLLQESGSEETEVVVYTCQGSSSFFLPLWELANVQKMAEFEFKLVEVGELCQVHIRAWLLPSAFTEGTNPLSLKGGHRNLQKLVKRFRPPSSPPPSSLSSSSSTSSSSVGGKKKSVVDLLPLYEAILPSPTLEAAKQPKGLTCTLRGYQRRALAWMIRKEMVAPSSSRLGLHYLWDEITLPLGDSPSLSSSSSSPHYNIYFNSMTGALSRHFMSCEDEEKVPGGILAEEMGLGKTVEVIACILSNAYSKSKVLPTEVGEGMKVIKGTLIISPETIVRQWESEIARHAPGLKVYKYEGVKEDMKQEKVAQKKSVKRRKMETTPAKMEASSSSSSSSPPPPSSDWSKFDVVLTTYEALRSEIHYANENRSLRYEKKYVPKRTPLLGHHWWRIALDEAQMVETPTANAAKMALKLETKHRWCVTGTPIGTGLDDLYGLALFLRTDPFDSKPIWLKGLERPYIKGQQRPLLGYLRHHLWRNSKAAVSGELDLPSQRTELIGLDFSPIERAYYQRILFDCKSRVNRLGGGENEEKMLDIILRLRQTCVHPQIGGHNSNTLGKELLSMDEVLSRMINDRIDQIGGLTRDHIHQSTIAAAIFIHLGHFEKAEQLCLKTIEYAGQGLEFLRECREQHESVNPVSVPSVPHVGLMSSEEGYGGSGKEPEDDPTSKPSSVPPPSSSSLSSAGSKRKIQEAEEEEDDFLVDPEGMEEDQEEEAEAEAEETEQEKKRKRDERHFTERLLAAKYNLAQCWTQMDKNKKEGKVLLQEVEEYRRKVAAPRLEKIERAELRKNNVTRRINRLKYNLEDLVEDSRELTDLLAEQEGEFLKALPRIELREEHEEVLDQLIRACGHFSSCAEELETTRPETLRLLRARITLEEAATEEGLENFRQELRKAKQSMDEHSVSLGSFERALRQLNQRAKEFNSHLKKNGKALKNHEKKKQRDTILPVAEENIAGLIMNCRRMTGLVVLWKREEAGMRSLWEGLRELRNRFASLQESLESSAAFKRKKLVKLNLDGIDEEEDEEFSDEDEEEGVKMKETVLFDITSIKRSLVQAQEGLENARSNCEVEKRRLKHLLTLMQAVASKDKECPVCLEVVSHSVMTPCAHFFCNDCIRSCLKQNPVCPVCRAALKEGDLVVVASKEVLEGTSGRKGKEEETGEEKDVRTLRGLPRAISTIIVRGSFGTKIDSLLKYILHLQKTKPKEKSLVFSQWKDSLAVIAHALGANNINFVQFQTVGRKTKKSEVVKSFQEDENVRVILLHAKTDSAGLTLVRATHVFLMEPLLNPAIELQAVARVHRMGQTKETHVHKFIIQNTIEERILLARSTGALKRTNTPPNATQLKKEENETVTKEELEYYLTV